MCTYNICFSEEIRQIICYYKISTYCYCLTSFMLGIFAGKTYFTDKTSFAPNEPRCEKTGLRGFRPGPTQTGLYNHTRWLEA